MQKELQCLNWNKKKRAEECTKEEEEEKRKGGRRNIILGDTHYYGRMKVGGACSTYGGK